jgi:glucose-1-phosphate adenylyltransferase
VNTVALVLAGGEGSRLYPLTAEHSKPALPFAGGFRIVDFVLSNLLNSRISAVYVLAQYKPGSLIRHIDQAWTSWFAEAGGFIRVVLPPPGVPSGHFRGTADAASHGLDLVQAHKPELVAVFSADHIYRMDVRQMMHFHSQRLAEVTVAAATVPIEHASSFGVIATALDGRVLDFREKPAHPSAIPGRPDRAYASMGNYLFSPQVLERALTDARRLGETDFGRHVLPRLSVSRRVYAYDFSTNRVPGVNESEEAAYWRDVGTLSALAAAQRDAMGHRPRFSLVNRHWPIRGEHDAALLAKLRQWRQRVEPPSLPHPVRPGSATAVANIAGGS